MNKLTAFLKNKWFILAISIFNGLYTALLCYFAYSVFFYKIAYGNNIKFAIVYSVFSVLVGLFMYYTRKSTLTCVFNMLNMFAFLPTLLLDWGDWPLLIPAALVSLFGFFSCKMNDTVKTVFGTVFLLMYIVCCIGFFLVMNVFRVTTIDTVMENGVSPSGYFRYYVLNVENKSSGKTAVYVEPNTMDVNVGGMMTLRTTIKKLVKQANNPTEVEITWDGAKMYINGQEYFDESDFVETANGTPVYNFVDDNWVHTYFEANYPIFDAFHRVYSAISEKLKSSNEPETTTVSE